MAKGVVLSTEVIEQGHGGAVICAVRLSTDAVRGLITSGAQIRLHAEDIEDTGKQAAGESVSRMKLAANG